MTHRRRLALLAAALGLMASSATASPDPKALPPAAVMRIPDSAARPTRVVDVNAPLMRGEFAGAVRVPADRAAMRDRIERQRAVEAERFARGAGPAISVRLRRSKY